MTKTERREKLKRLISTQFSNTDQFIDSLHGVNDRTSDYLLYWEGNKKRAKVCARTGNITAYRQCDGDVVDTHILKFEDKGEL